MREFKVNVADETTGGFSQVPGTVYSIEVARQKGRSEELA
jgi:hypothetical protein